MSGSTRFLGALGLGAGLFYMLDPDRGGARQALLRDRLRALSRRGGAFWDAATRDLENRAQGLVASLAPAGPASDEALVARVRAQLGRAVSHPRVITVLATDGVVTLSGPVLRREVDGLLRAIARVPGVKQLNDQLDVHVSRQGTAALGPATANETGERAQEGWAPGPRLLAGLGGAALTLRGVAKGGLGGSAEGLAGVLLLGRALTNMPISRMLGLAPGRGGIDIHKTITIGAPVGEVFAFFERPENLPRMLSHVREVRDLGNGRSHWEVAGPVGLPIAFDTVITRWENQRLLAWRTEPNAMVDHAGMLRFEPAGPHATRLSLRMAYNPPLGVVGHAIAHLFAADPGAELDGDLNQLKVLLEMRQVGQQP